MIALDEIARTALKRDALMLRALAQEFIHTQPSLEFVRRPDSTVSKELALAASLVELFAMRANQSPPAWANDVPPSPEPFYLLAYAEKMPRLKQMCHDESPEPLRKRGFYAPPNFLEFA